MLSSSVTRCTSQILSTKYSCGQILPLHWAVFWNLQPKVIDSCCIEQIKSEIWYPLKFGIIFLENHSPADCATRGIYTYQIKDSKSWWCGPTWLCISSNTFVGEHLQFQTFLFCLYTPKALVYWIESIMMWTFLHDSCHIRNYSE